MTPEILFDSIIGNVFEIITTIITLIVSYYVIPFIKNDAIPWLEEKRVYEMVRKFVAAAEKMAESGTIKKADKKETVIKLLQKKGIVVTDELSALIESCVKELDLIVNTTITEIKNEN